MTDTCWLWIGATAGKGYGHFWLGRHVAAHRYSYERLVGPIPEGLTIDHLCRVKLCVRPEHLEVVDNKTNVLRGFGPTAINSRKTHCVHGHPLTPDNLMDYPSTEGRICRTCNVERVRKSNAKAKVNKTGPYAPGRRRKPLLARPPSG